MRSTACGRTRFNHNGDFSGDVTIIAYPTFVEQVTNDGHIPEHYEVSVPFADMKALVFDYLRDQLTKIVESSDEDFEKWLTRQV